MNRSLKLVTTFVLIVGLISSTMLNQRAEATVPGVNTLVSVNNTGDGQGGNGQSPHDTSSKNQSVSADGRYVVFTSNASNLVSGDTNGRSDVFVRDLVNGVTTRVNVSNSGVQANDNVNNANFQGAAISSTGRYVAFTSRATNLIDGQTTSHAQVYMHDRSTGATTIVSKKSDGTLANKDVAGVYGVSDDGRFVVWEGNLLTSLVSTETNIYSYFVYLTDTQNQTTIVLNHTPSATGQYFINGITMSCDGAFVAYSTRLQLVSGDTDSNEDVYLVDLRNGMQVSGITTVSSIDGYDIFPSLSCNGDYLTFQSNGKGLITSGPSPSDSYLHQLLYDRINGSITLADTSTSGSIANYDSGNTYGGAVDDRGDVTFTTGATNLIDGHTVAAGQLYLKHNDTQQTELISKTPGGTAWSGATSIGGTPSISSDGKVVIYRTGSSATTLLSSDTNGFGDVVASSTGL